MGASWRRTLSAGALAGVGIGVVLPLVVIIAGGALGLALRGKTFLDVGQTLNRTAPVLLAFLDAPARVMAGAFPGHSDSALLTVVAPPLMWAAAGMAVAAVRRLLMRR
ncbi:MAG: hypothetical protein AB7Y46_11470 [Armatimonadota bacterium]